MCKYISGTVGQEWKQLAWNLEIDDETIDETDGDGDNANYGRKCKKVIKCSTGKNVKVEPDERHFW